MCRAQFVLGVGRRNVLRPLVPQRPRLVGRLQRAKLGARQDCGGGKGGAVSGMGVETVCPGTNGIVSNVAHIDFRHRTPGCTSRESIPGPADNGLKLIPRPLVRIESGLARVGESQFEVSAVAIRQQPHHLIAERDEMFIKRASFIPINRRPLDFAVGNKLPPSNPKI